MDDTNGFDAAEELMSGSSQPLIVFVTKSTEYTIRGYDVAFHYLVKPLNEAKFHEVLKRALRLIIPQYFYILLERRIVSYPCTRNSVFRVS